MALHQSTIYQALILTQLPAIGNITARKLVAACGSIEAVFKEKSNHLASIEGINKNVVHSLKNIQSDIYDKAEKELAFIEKNQIQTYILNEENYPKRLRHCPDAPLLFFGRGNMDFNVPKVIAIVGTRMATAYGKNFTKRLISDLSDYDILIVSGLALGIDTAVHEASLHHNQQTIAVLGHGLKMIYPASNRKLATRMLQKGGIITEFMSDAIPDAINFPLRNRIIAGLSDAVVVVEAKKEGGALITANLGFSYDRDIFAIPGRVGDINSEGCHNLIKSNKAALITSAADILEIMRWSDEEEKRKNRQEKLFFDISEEEKHIIEAIKQENEVNIDSLLLKINMPHARLVSVLLELECKGYIECLPGKRYTLT